MPNYKIIKVNGGPTVQVEDTTAVYHSALGAQKFAFDANRWVYDICGYYLSEHDPAVLEHANSAYQVNGGITMNDILNSPRLRRIFGYKVTISADDLVAYIDTTTPLFPVDSTTIITYP